MSELRDGYAIMHRDTGALLSRVVETYEEAKELLRTAPANTPVVVCTVAGVGGWPPGPWTGDNSPG